MTKETLEKAQKLNDKISKLNGDIETLEKFLKSTSLNLRITVCEDGEERSIAFLKEEFNTNAALQVLLDMYIEKRDKLKAEFLAL